PGRSGQGGAAPVVRPRRAARRRGARPLLRRPARLRGGVRHLRARLPRAARDLEARSRRVDVDAGVKGALAGAVGGAGAAARAARGSAVAAARPVSGGDINEAYALALADGRRLFAKANGRSDVGTLEGFRPPPATDSAGRSPASSTRSTRWMFAAEARGLAWLAEARALRIPEVVAVARPEDEHQFLVLELVATGSPARDSAGGRGRGLPAPPRHGAPGFGLDHDNFVGSLPQENAGAPSWPEFYRARRLEPLLRRAADRGLASSRMR